MLEDRLTNSSRCTVRVLPLVDRHGQDVLVVVMKMALEIGQDGAIRRVAAAAVRTADEYHAAPYAGSIRFPSDAVYFKPGTDVLLVGTAHPPHTGARNRSEVMMTVTGKQPLISKRVLVYGPRVWVNAAAAVLGSEPATMPPTPLVYELACRDAERNPGGRDVAPSRAARVGTPLPALEDPAAPSTSRKPRPAGFGPIAAHWEPRRSRYGTCDAVWRRERAPLPPSDHDTRYASCAPDDQWCATPFEGGERIDVAGATRPGAWSFRLPRYAPIVYSQCRGVEREHHPTLDTVLVDADALCVELSWRIAVARPRKLAWLQRIHVRAKHEDELRGALYRSMLQG